MLIPFNKPYLSGKEFDYMRAAVDAGHLSGDGQFTKLCNPWLEKLTGARKAVLTTSCTHALEMSALLLNIQPGDEVILPSFTFVSTANAFVLRGAKPVFVDVRADTLNIDETQIEAKITRRTKAIVPVHYGGVGCEMDAIMDIAKRHKLAVVEDNAQGLFGKYRGKPLGSFGAFAAQSFHETKNVQCGEGGALLINDAEQIERAEIIREKGTNRSRFFRGQVDKYTWVDLGSSYLPSELLAAYLWAQFESAEDIQARRREIWQNYYAHLESWASKNGVMLPSIPVHCEQAYHLFYVILPSLQHQQAFIAHLKEREVNAVFHYQSLHLSDMGQRYGGKAGDCPVTEHVSESLVRLPFYYELTEDLQEQVVDAVLDFDFSKVAA